MAHDGLLLVDKPRQLTSHDVVAQVRRWLGQQSVGHAGTLDPLATGLLVLLVGKATKLSDYILNGDKGYQVKVQLGVNTDTDDVTGQVIANSPAHFSQEQVSQQVLQLQGPLTLQVPVYSAIKQNGKKLYELARAQQVVVAPWRPMNIQNVKILAAGPDWVSVQFSCSKGTYVRSWVRELGQRLGCGAAVEELRRILSLPYQVEQAITLEELLSSSPEELGKGWVPLEKTLPGCPTVKIAGREEKLLLNGQIPRRLERFLEIEFADRPGLHNGIKVISRNSGKLLSILQQESPLKFTIRRVFPA